MSVATSNIFSMSNGQAADIANVTGMSLGDFRSSIIEAVKQGLRISALFGQPIEEGRLRLWAVLSHDARSVVHLLHADLDGDRYDSITPDCPQAHWFEREIFEQWKVKPCGHPWLKPIRFHAPYGQASQGRAEPLPEIGVTDFFGIEGC